MSRKNTSSESESSAKNSMMAREDFVNKLGKIKIRASAGILHLTTGRLAKFIDGPIQEIRRTSEPLPDTTEYLEFILFKIRELSEVSKPDIRDSLKWVHNQNRKDYIDEEKDNLSRFIEEIKDIFIEGDEERLGEKNREKLQSAMNTTVEMLHRRFAKTVAEVSGEQTIAPTVKTRISDELAKAVIAKQQEASQQALQKNSPEHQTFMEEIGFEALCHVLNQPHLVQYSQHEAVAASADQSLLACSPPPLTYLNNPKAKRHERDDEDSTQSQDDGRGAKRNPAPTSTTKPKISAQLGGSTVTKDVCGKYLPARQ